MDLDNLDTIDVTKITPEFLEKLEVLNQQLAYKVINNKKTLINLREKYEELQRLQNNQSVAGTVNSW